MNFDRFELGSQNFYLSFIKRTGPAVVMTITGVKLTVNTVSGNSGFHCQTDCTQAHKIDLCTR